MCCFDPQDIVKADIYEKKNNTTTICEHCAASNKVYIICLS